MKLLEYEAKRLLEEHGVPIPAGQLVRGVDDAITLPFPLVLKVQIPKGSRGKAGGIKIVNSQAEHAQIAAELLAKPILDCEVSALLAEEVLSYTRELYLAITIDRSTNALSLLAHGRGGVEIEQAASEADPLLKIALYEVPGLMVANQLQAYFHLPDTSSEELLTLLKRLYETCLQEDALLVEINPLMVLADGKFVCADAKIELDDAAHFRHSDWSFEATVTSNQFVELNPAGTVASMANGAGLAMATVDAIKAAGAEPANFFDVGGGTNVEGMVRAFQQLAGMPSVQAIVVNIFAGITRCDEVAQAITEAKKVCDNLPKLCIRLTGTNEAQGKKLLEAAGIPFYPTLAACVQEAVK